MISTLLMAFSAGVLSTLHCWGMCGSLILALHAGVPGAGSTPRTRLLLTGLYHAGRMVCYALLGAAGGSLLSLGAGQQALAYRLLQTLAALALVLAGLRLAGWRRGSWLETLGLRLWRPVAPLGRRLWPIDRPSRALASGMLWGLLPCGLVYAMLPVAAASGSAARGGLVMLAFGLGTLPGMFGASLVAGRLAPYVERASWRRIAGVALIAMALLWWLLQGLGHPPHAHSEHAAHPAHRQGAP